MIVVISFNYMHLYVVWWNESYATCSSGCALTDGSASASGYALANDYGPIGGSALVGWCDTTKGCPIEKC